MVKKGCKGDATVLRPTIMAAVPLILDRVHKAIREKVGQRGPRFQGIFDWAFEYRLEALKQGEFCPIMDFLIFRKMKAALGGKVKGIFTGGAPISPSFRDVPLRQLAFLPSLPLPSLPPPPYRVTSSPLHFTACPEDFLQSWRFFGVVVTSLYPLENLKFKSEFWPPWPMNQPCKNKNKNPNLGFSTCSDFNRRRCSGLPSEPLLWILC